MDVAMTVTGVLLLFWAVYMVSVFDRENLRTAKLLSNTIRQNLELTDRVKELEAEAVRLRAAAERAGYRVSAQRDPL